MNNRIVRPVRAWAEYDQWLVYLEFEDGKLGFRRYVIPKGEAGRLTESFDLFPGVAAALKGDGPKSGSLRSLRVLYENGCELTLQRRFGGTFWGWSIELSDEFNEIKAPWPGGSFTEDKDSEAVERALIAAAAWFTQAEQR